MTAAAFGALTAGTAGGVLPGGTLAMLRNLAGMTGTGLLSAAALGGAFGWTGLLAGHRVGAGRALDHAMDLASPAAARPRRGHLRCAGARRRDRGRHPPRRPGLRPPLRPRLSTGTPPIRLALKHFRHIDEIRPRPLRCAAVRLVQLAAATHRPSGMAACRAGLLDPLAEGDDWPDGVVRVGGSRLR
jgi:hypothetical protein